MAATVDARIHTYHAEGHDLPCVVLVAYDTDDVVVTDISDTDHADLLILGQASAFRTADKGTTIGKFEYGTDYAA